MKLQRSIEILAPPKAIWPLLTDPEKILKWFNLLRRFEYTGDRREGVGTTFYYEEKSGGQLMRLNYVVTDWSQNQKLAFRVTSGSLKKDDQIWSIDAIPSGSRFTMFEDLEMPLGIVGKIVGFLFGGMMIGRSMEKILANLKRMAEAVG
jgi:uncharacterized protein YndB with AHSA1/START domain